MEGQEEMLAVSDAGYAEMASRYDALMAEAEQNGARWAWYTDYGLDPRPLHFYLSRYDWPPGRPLLRQPRRIASGRVQRRWFRVSPVGGQHGHAGGWER
jgi:hypothetical protein